MSDREETLSAELRETIKRMDRWLSGVEAAYLTSPELRGADEKRCRAVTTFDRLRVDIEVRFPPQPCLVELHCDNVPLHEVESDVD